MKIETYFQSLLSSYWLRPESALWYAHVLSFADSFIGNELGEGSLDFGCMEGVNSCILLGGQLGLEFDVYGEVKWTRDSYKKSVETGDYFDLADPNNCLIAPTLVPPKKFTFGVDWKDSHLIKARRMKAHENFLKIDLERPSFNLEDRSINTVWAPNLYWSPNMDATLRELSRIIAPKGRIITVCPDIKQLDYMLIQYRNHFDPAWLSELDRGKFVNLKRHSKTFDDWEALFNRFDLRVTRHDFFIPPNVARVYDLGFRPFFPVFMNMYEKIKTHSREDLLDLKRHWMETVTHFFEPLLDPKPLNVQSSDMACHIFELKLRS